MTDRTFRVLSIDGGGVRGYLPALVLAELERRAGRPVGDLFDLIVGTSTGGIIGIGAAVGIPASELAQFYPRCGRRIFGGTDKKSDLQKRLFGGGATFAESMERAALGFSPSGARYRPAGLESVLQEVFGDQRLAQVRTSLAITTFDSATAMPVVLSSRDAIVDPTCDLLLRDVARATSAAPTFFPPLTVSWAGAERQFVDGGIWANNPAAVGLSEALALTSDSASTPALTMVSLGTGAAPAKPVLEENGLRLGYALDLVSLSTSVWSGELLARRALPAHRFHRFQVVDARIAGAMDDPSTERLAALESAAQTLISRRTSELDAAVVPRPGPARRARTFRSIRALPAARHRRLG